MNKILPLAIVLFSVAFTSVAFAEFATSRIYFNVPATTTFSIGMPDTYTGGQNFSISGTSQASASATDWLSFNFSSIAQSALQEPSALGSFTRNQSGITRPIFLIDNTGNVNISVSIYVNESIPNNVQLWWNGSTWPATGCGTTNSTIRSVSLTADLIVGIGSTGTDKLAPGPSPINCRLNVTLYSNTSAGVSGGQLTTNLITNSST